MLTLLFFKVLGLVWPPLPGGIFTLGSTLIIGWYYAYSVDLVGTLIGSSFAFFLARKYGVPFMKKLLSEAMVERILKVKFKKEREIEAIFLLRLGGSSIMLEAICYAAGILGVAYKNFLVGSLLSHMLTGIPQFFLVGNLLGRGNILLTGALFILIIGLFVTFRKRYIE